jgi:hypothetical protein
MERRTSRGRIDRDCHDNMMAQIPDNEAPRLDSTENRVHPQDLHDR